MTHMVAGQIPHCQARRSVNCPRAIVRGTRQSFGMPLKRAHIARFMQAFTETGKGGTSRRSVAEALKIDESTLRDWENPEGSTPRLELIYRFCEKFNVPLWEFLGERDALVLEIEELSQKVETLEQRLAEVRRALAQPGPEANARQR